MSLTVNSMSIEIPTASGCEVVQLFTERAVYWPAKQTLMVTDLHWGKPETFRSHGIPITGGVLEDDLDRLSWAIGKAGARRVIVLGDLIHGKMGMTDGLIRHIAEWREQNPVEMMLVRGNHDRHYRDLPDAWNIFAFEEKWTEGPFVFAHQPDPCEGYFVWAGHVHPTVVMRGKRDRLRFPCFHLTESVGILPAFSVFTGGYNIQKQLGERVIAIAGPDLIEL